MKRSQTGVAQLLFALGDEGESPRSARFGTLLLIAVLASALAFRLLLAIRSHFPIVDGALFFDFVRAIAETFPHLPASVRYNSLDIPFAYPPLSFWLAAGATRLGIEPLAIVHYAPIAMNAGYVLLFALLLLRHRHSRLHVALAVLFAVTTLRSFEWLVMGGGLSRGLGSLFMLASLIAVGLPPAWQDRVAAGPSRGRLLLAGLCIGLAIVSHLEWGLLATGCFVASRALGARHLTRFVLDNVVAGAAALAVVAPWAAFVIEVHGIGPFLAAGGSSAWSLSLTGLRVLGILIQNGGNIFMWLGLAVLIARRDWFWPCFILLCIALTPRQADTPVVLAIGAISAQGVLASLRLLARFDLSPARSGAVAALLVLLTAGWQIQRDWALSSLSQPLSPAKLEAMAWVRDHHPGRDYLVLSGRFWAYDASAEWLPTLTRAHGLNTVQGREWLPDGAYLRSYVMSLDVLKSETCEELDGALRAYGRADFVWAERDHACFEAPAYKPVFRNREVTIFEVAAAPA